MANDANPMGYVPAFDFGNPKIVTAKAIETITAGQMIYFSGAEDSVSSGINTFSADDILACKGASGAAFNGIATQTVTSGNYVGVASDVVAICRAGNTVTAGYNVITSEAENNIQNGTTAGNVVGRALTGAASGGYALVHIK